jgi:lysophospholipase L1-like esterase
MITLKAISSCAIAALALFTGVASAGDRSDAQAPGLALGDSVAFGYVTRAGYEYVNAINFLGSPEYLTDLLHLPMTNAGCPGETSASLLSLTATDHGCRAFRTAYPLHVSYASSQIDFATAFLRGHPDARLVTIEVGANDVFVLQDGCAASANPALCVQAGLPAVLASVASNVGTILATLRAGGFGGVIVLVNYYSPDYTNPTDNALTSLLNQAIAAPAQAYGAVIADVFGAFQKAAAAAGGKPCNAGLLNVDPQNESLCDVHPSLSGQRLIATTIARAYRSMAW